MFYVIRKIVINTVVIFVLSFGASYLLSVGYNPVGDDGAKIPLLIGFLCWIIMVVMVLYSNRIRIKEDVIDKSIDAAAASMDFKDAVRDRIEERRRERRK